jgi:hypothetical protein
MRKSWTDEEREKLIDLYNSGTSHKEMAIKLDRTTSAIGNEISILIKKGGTSKRKKNTGKSWKKYATLSKKSYKSVLPREKWPVIENFLAAFCRYAGEAEKTGRVLDVYVFMSEYRKIYGKKEVQELLRV